MNKEAEKKRLASIVFNGAVKWAKAASMNENGNWCYFEFVPKTWSYAGLWDNNSGRCKYCKNQPETKLDWTETLLKRSDYE